MVALTAFIFGFHCSFSPSTFLPFLSYVEYPPRANDSSPNLSLCAVLMVCLSVLHLGHVNKKWTADSTTPHSHLSVSVAAILLKYSFSLAIPVRSWPKMAASVLHRLSYSILVCLPGRALSTFLVNLPVFDVSNRLTFGLNPALFARAYTVDIGTLSASGTGSLSFS